MTNAEIIWKYFENKKFSSYAIAGIMGNLYAESRLLPNNLQDSYNRSLGLSDEEYTKRVDNGTYSNFIYDQAGYGLAQWTFWSLKEELYKLCKEREKSISDINCQLDCLYNQIQSHKLLGLLNSATSIREASDIFLTKFERPKDQGESVKSTRANSGQQFYNEFANKKQQTVISKNRDLGKCDKGSDVKELQENLITLGYSCGPDGADGDFGNNTDIAVRKFQKDHNLVQDGIVGNNTKAAIATALKNKTSTPTAPDKKSYYRVRKSWTDAASQIGAFLDLNNAIDACNKAGSGYKVFDATGKQVYEYTVKEEKPIVVVEEPAPKYSGVVIGSSSKDENGTYRGGQAGDQTGKEVYTLNWYNNGWTQVIRPKSSSLANKIASACEKGCNNSCIGYDQGQRNTLLAEAKKVGLDMSKITTPCECDCSSFVSTCCVCAGLPEGIFFAGGNGRTTYNLSAACQQTGQFDILTDAMYLNGKDYLKRGDILVSSGHTVIVLSNGAKASTTISSEESVKSTSYLVRVNTNILNVRSGPSKDYVITTKIKRNEIYTIVQEEGGWGKLKSGAGWIDLSYTEKV